MKKRLVIILGPTCVGKTELSIHIAGGLNTEIISADSRQIFKELQIGTAAPTLEQLAKVKHHMVGTHSIWDYYSAYQFEKDSLNILDELLKDNDSVVMTGGSTLYIDAVCKGIDDIPTIDLELREELRKLYKKEGIRLICRWLKSLDPEYHAQVDLRNHKRVIYALEVCLMAGKPYSLLRTKSVKKRPFGILKIGLNIDRAELYRRINERVEDMVKKGLFEEAAKFYSLKHLNALNTVGYKEIFAHWDGEYDVDIAVEMIKRNSRRYAKRQLSWFRRDQQIHWFHPTEMGKIISFINNICKN